MNRFKSKIDAIKTVREIASKGKEPVYEAVHGNFSQTEPLYRLVGTGGLGLKDAKDLIEEIMDLGVRQFLDDPIGYIHDRPNSTKRETQCF